MFGPLDKYLEEAWFASHSDGELTVDGRIYPLRVFAVVETDASAKEIFSPKETDPKETFRYVKEKALYYNAGLAPEPDKGERLLGLSTCRSPNAAERTVVFCAY